VLPERTVKQLCDKLKEQLIYESNVLSLSSPLTVVGDLHGFGPPLPSSPSPLDI
jgi:serine/threonine-protein phosphatase PPG1